MTSEDLGLLSLVGNYQLYLGGLAKECRFGGVSPLAISYLYYLLQDPMGDILRINVIYSRGSFIRMQPGTQTHLRWVYYAAIDYNTLNNKPI